MTARKRPYVSSLRRAAAAQTRAHVVEAALQLLRAEAGITGFSLDAVAKAAGVTRLTVYHQFGSRRGLLEAAFDEVARQGGLTRLADAMALPDPHAALDHVIDIFCAFWSESPAVGRLHDAVALDPEFGVALVTRNERRRVLLNRLVSRIAPTAPARTRRDAVDLMFALTSQPMFAMLRRRRSVEAVARLIKDAGRAALPHS